MILGTPPSVHKTLQKDDVGYSAIRYAHVAQSPVKGKSITWSLVSLPSSMRELHIAL